MSTLSTAAFPTLSTTAGSTSASNTGNNLPVEQGASYIEESQGFGHPDYMIVNRFEKDHHTYQIGVASPGGFQGNSVAFVKVASSTLTWICDWTTSRVGAQPIIPDPTSLDPNWILLDEVYQPVMITVMPDGNTPVYRISGTYIYGLKNPNATTIRNAYFGRPPWLENTFDRTVPTTSLQQGLSSITGGSTTGPLTQGVAIPGVP